MFNYITWPVKISDQEGVSFNLGMAGYCTTNSDQIRILILDSSHQKKENRMNERECVLS